MPLRCASVEYHRHLSIRARSGFFSRPMPSIRGLRCSLRHLILQYTRPHGYRNLPWWLMLGIQYRTGFELPGQSPILADLHTRRELHTFCAPDLRLEARYVGPLAASFVTVELRNRYQAPASATSLATPFQDVCFFVVFRGISISQSPATLVCQATLIWESDGEGHAFRVSGGADLLRQAYALSALIYEPHSSGSRQSPVKMFVTSR